MGKIADRLGYSRFSVRAWQTSFILASVYMSMWTLIRRRRRVSSLRQKKKRLHHLYFFFRKLIALPQSLVIFQRHLSITFTFWDCEGENKHYSLSVCLTLKPLPDMALSISPHLFLARENSFEQHVLEHHGVSTPFIPLSGVGRVYALYLLFVSGMYWCSTWHPALEIAPTGAQRRDIPSRSRMENNRMLCHFGNHTPSPAHILSVVVSLSISWPRTRWPLWKRPLYMRDCGLLTADRCLCDETLDPLLNTETPP